MRSFRGTMIISKENLHPSILSTCTVHFSDIKISCHPLLLMHFLSVYFRTPVAVKQTSYRSSYIFRAASIILKWNESSHLKQLLFRKKDFFRTPSCLEELLLSNNYFLKTNTFSDLLLLEYNYYFSTAMFRMSYFLRINNYSKLVLFRSSRFFCTATFSEESISWEESLFVNS